MHKNPEFKIVHGVIFRMISELIAYIKSVGFETNDGVWYNSPLKTFSIGIENGVVVYWDKSMDFSNQLPSTNILSTIRILLMKEILES